MKNQDELESAIRVMLEHIGEDPNRDGLIDTPQRVARMYGELFSGLTEDPKAVLGTTFDQPYDEMVMVKDIPFHSMCEHHLMPFIGTVAVAYIPSDRVVGLSKIGRLVDILSRRPQIQERITVEVADCIEEVLNPRGVAVRIKAEHLCMSMRGIKKPGSTMITTVTRGVFRTKASTRNEFLISLDNS